MNNLPDTLKLKYEDPPAVEEPNIKEVISEAGEVIEVNEETSEENPNFVYDESIPLEKPDDVEPDMPLFVPKPQPVAKDIFTAPKKEVKLTKKGKPRKPMSEEHKAKLAVAREKANAKKRWLKEQRDAKKKATENMSVPAEAITQPEVQEIKQEASPRSPTPIRSKSPPVKYVGVTQEQLEASHLKAVLTAETLRKKRKEEKRLKQKEQEYAKETMQTIQKLTWRDTAGIYANCY